MARLSPERIAEYVEELRKEIDEAERDLAEKRKALGRIQMAARVEIVNGDDDAS